VSESEHLVTDGGQGCRPRSRPELAEERFGLTTNLVTRRCCVAARQLGAVLKLAIASVSRPASRTMWPMPAGRHGRRRLGSEFSARDALPVALSLIMPARCWRARLTAVTVIGLCSAGFWLAATSSLIVSASAATPPPSGQLAGVSCVGPRFCSAVGGSAPIGVPLAISWNGFQWTERGVIAPAGAGSVWLNAVSCRSALFCVAVGFSAGTAHPGPFDLLSPVVAVSRGDDWRPQTNIPPVGAASELLTDVSCTSPRFCVAVGNRGTARYVGVAWHWNGARWTAHSLPHAGDGQLTAVSCARRTDCMAVGAGFADHWNGRRWIAQRLPKKLHGVFLTGVSCPTPGSCAVTGEMMSAFWHAKRWSLTRIPDIVNPEVGGERVGQLACTNLSFCVAVGSWNPGGDSVDFSYGFVARWNGIRWTIHDASSLVHPGLTGLNDVSCVARQICTAVGLSSVENITSGSVLSFAARRPRHGDWVVQATPNAS
jgi:hypothetical protein